MWHLHVLFPLGCVKSRDTWVLISVVKPPNPSLGASVLGDRSYATYLGSISLLNWFTEREDEQRLSTQKPTIACRA